MAKVLTDQDRRQMLLDALSPDANISRIAKTYGINRNTLYEHVNRAVRDPERQWREAEEEAAFRRRVYEMTR
jgi:transposase-like protein